MDDPNATRYGPPPQRGTTQPLSLYARSVSAPGAPTKRGRRVSSGWLVMAGLVVVLLGSGAALALNLSKNTATSASPASGSGSNGSGSGSAPVSGPDGKQTLPAINRAAYYAGVKVTLLSAIEAQHLPGFQPVNANDNGLELQARLENGTPRTVEIGDATYLVDASGKVTPPTPTSAQGALPPVVNPGASMTGVVYFEVAPGSPIDAFALLLQAGSIASNHSPDRPL